MGKNVIWALVILVLSVVVLIFNSKANMPLNLVIAQVKPLTSLVLFAFMGLGVIVGLLLK